VSHSPRGIGNCQDPAPERMAWSLEAQNPKAPSGQRFFRPRQPISPEYCQTGRATAHSDAWRCNTGRSGLIAV